VLAVGAELRVATDDPDYLAWILEQFAARGDFRPSAHADADRRERPSDWPPTRYECKAIAAGRRPAYLRFLRVPYPCAAPAPENLA